VAHIGFVISREVVQKIVSDPQMSPPVNAAAVMSVAIDGQLSYLADSGRAAAVDELVNECRMPVTALCQPATDVGLPEPAVPDVFHADRGHNCSSGGMFLSCPSGLFYIWNNGRLNFDALYKAH